MHLHLEHPAGFSADVDYNGGLWIEGEIKKHDTMGGPTTSDGRMWYFNVTVQGDHGQRDRRAITHGWATLTRDDGTDYRVGYVAPELTDLSDGTVLKLSASNESIEAFLADE
jgi:hypothetical protein